MANTFQFAQWVTIEALRTLKNKLAVASSFNMDESRNYKQPFAVNETVSVKMPNRYLTRSGLTYSAQDITRKATTVTMDRVRGVDFEWDSVEEALKLERQAEEVARQYLKPAMAQLAQTIDLDAAQFAAENCPNIVGVLGTNPTNADILGAARQRMVEFACPEGDYEAFVSPAMGNSIGNGMVSYFNDTGQVSKFFKEGFLTRARGFDLIESMSLFPMTAGTRAGAVTVNGAGQSGNTLNINCTSGDTFKKGEVFSIGLGVASQVNAVNPATRLSVGAAQFVITADVTAGATTASLPILVGDQGNDGIIGPGTAYQNVAALPAATAPLTFWPGTSTPNGKTGTNALAIHRDAFMMVSVPLPKPDARGVEMVSETRDPDTGLTIRFVRAWDNLLSKHTNRFDVFYGFGRGYVRSCAVRILGA